jgi:hypothetical protein
MVISSSKGSTMLPWMRNTMARYRRQQSWTDAGNVLRTSSIQATLDADLVTSSVALVSTNSREDGSDQATGMDGELRRGPAGSWVHSSRLPMKFLDLEGGGRNEWLKANFPRNRISEGTTKRRGSSLDAEAVMPIMHLLWWC